MFLWECFPLSSRGNKSIYVADVFWLGLNGVMIIYGHYVCWSEFWEGIFVWFLYRLQVIIEFLHVLAILGKKSRHLWIIWELIEAFGSKMTIYLSRLWFTSWRRWHGVMMSKTLPLWLCPLTDELWLTFFFLADLSHPEAKPWTWDVGPHLEQYPHPC